MGMPAAWAQRRYGLVVANSLASVPCWAPLGEDPLWYRHHLGQANGADDVPLAEVLAHHRDRWDHLDRYDDFARLARFEPGAPEHWAQLAAQAAATISFSTAKHHDGWCWWSAPATGRHVREGLGAATLNTHAAACERHGLAFGAVFSTLDWADPAAGTPDHVLEVATPQLASLLADERPDLLWLCGSRTPADHELLVALVGTSGSDTPIFSDAKLPGVVHVRAEMPSRIERDPWALWTGIGAAPGYNMAEPGHNLLRARDLVALYTEALAKGGGLLVSVGPDASGAISRDQADPVREAGVWIAHHADVLDRCTPWHRWGDEDTRILADPDDPSTLFVVDLTGRGRFRQLPPDVVHVHDATPATPHDDLAPPHVTQDRSGLVIDSGRSTAPVVWRLTVGPPARPAELFPVAEDESVDISDLLVHARPGEIVQLGEGTHHGRVTVPDRVTLRGLGPGRTTLRVEGPAVEVGRGSRLEHLTVTGGDDERPSSATLVVLVGERGRLLGCAVDGTVEIRADDGAVRGTRLRGAVAKGAERVSLAHSTLIGGPGDVAVRLLGGGEHLVDSCEIDGHGGGVLAYETTGTRIRGCNVSTRGFGVRLRHTEDARVRGNQFHRTGRAVDVDAGRQARVEGNAVFDGDSGCVVQQGAADAHVSGNHWERCRVGLLMWDAAVAEAHDNTAVDLLDADAVMVSGP